MKMMSSKTKQLPENPIAKANILSRLTFYFMLPIFFKGQRKDLTPSDLYRVLDEDKSEVVGEKLSTAWNTEILRSNCAGRQPSLLRATLRAFGVTLAILGLCLFLMEFCVRMSQPLLVGALINFYTQPDGNRAEAYVYAAAVIAASTLNVLMQHNLMLLQFHLAMKIRVAMISLIFRKSLRLSQASLANTTVGQIVNLLANDVGKFEYASIGLQMIWIGPLATALVVYILYRHIGVGAFAGVAFLAIFVPLQAYIGKKTSVLRAKTAIRSDERIRLMNEIILGIQVIKMYAWEKPFGLLVKSLRAREINTIRSMSYLRAILLSFSVFVNRFSILISLIVYALLGNYINAPSAFVVVAYYNLLRQNMTVHFPKGISEAAELLVSFKRIQKFLLSEEVKTQRNVDEKRPVENGDKNEHVSLAGPLETLEPASLKLVNVKAKWNPESAEYILANVSFSAMPGELIAIVGHVGAGKSSILQAILGELPTESGSITANGIISFASQEAWLFGGTVRENILFGQPMDKQRYKEVVKQCALDRDFQLFQFGDRTLIGDRGQLLSGGQKARINLARAVYRKAAIYLLDDPLSAVDTHVGRHLFEQCIKGFLKEHITVLVTHQLQFLKQADKIVVLEHGRVAGMGTYSELSKSELDVAKLLLDSETEDVETHELASKKEGDKLSRENSETSMQSIGGKARDAQMEVKEFQKRGSIGLKLYVKYFGAGGSVFLLFIMFSLCISAQILGSSCDYFLSYWVNKETSAGSRTDTIQVSNVSFLERETFPQTLNSSNVHDNLSSPQRNMLDIYIFTSLVVATVIVTIVRSFSVFDVAMRASYKLHGGMYHGVSRATMYFFNTNPAGRILNRFSKDIGQVDEVLPAVILEVIQIFLTLAGIVTVIVIVNTWFIIPTLLMVIVFYKLRSFYLKTSRDVKRMEGITRSPIFSNLSSSLLGLPTIRAFAAEDIVSKKFDIEQNNHSSVFFLFIATSRAFGFWLDCICVLYIAAVTLSFFLLGEQQAGNVGLAITQAISMTGMIQWDMRQSAELENTMAAVERVVEYAKLDREEEQEPLESKKPPKDWPNNGHIRFNSVSMRYSPDPSSSRILKKIVLEIMPKEKVGIVGRTGAGKSSIINALFRLAYNEGSIIIDSCNTESLGLPELRSKISIIPQEPVLFSGTIRFNLDPFEEYTDEKIWRALEQIKIKEAVSELPLGLQSKVNEGGSNFSVGQRQLLCLARAILRENKILVLDEATANVDTQSDNLIQNTIKDKFKDCTVLTIAHRLHTIIDSDKVLVMDAGRMVEYGPPYTLLTQLQTRVFYDMVLEMGQSSFKNLLEIARTKHG